MVTIVNITTRMDVWVCIRQGDSAKARKNLVFTIKFTWGAARSLHARTYMMRNDWGNMKAAAEEVMQGIWEADLGSGVIKKRLPLQQGKSGGARTIIFFKSANHVFFYDGWSKSGLSSKGTKEIEDDELAAYKKMANAFLAFSNKQIEDLIETGFLIEVKNER